MDEYTKSNDEDQKLTDRNKELENEIQKLKDEKQELKDKIQKLNDEIGYAIESLDYHGFEECNKCCFWIKIDDLPKCNECNVPICEHCGPPLSDDNDEYSRYCTKCNKKFCNKCILYYDDYEGICKDCSLGK